MYDRNTFYAKISDRLDIDINTIDKVLKIYGEEFYQNILDYTPNLHWYDKIISLEDLVIVFGRYLGIFCSRPL